MRATPYAQYLWRERGGAVDTRLGRRLAACRPHRYISPRLLQTPSEAPLAHAQPTTYACRRGQRDEPQGVVVGMGTGMKWKAIGKMRNL